MKEEVDVDGQLVKTFAKLTSTIEASLPEQIGVEFLLRDINDSSKTSIHKLVSIIYNLRLMIKSHRLKLWYKDYQK